jgi:hypothetical protein
MGLGFIEKGDPKKKIKLNARQFQFVFDVMTFF